MTLDNVGNKGENDSGEAYKSSRDVIEDQLVLKSDVGTILNAVQIIIQHHALDSPYLCSLNGNQSNRGGDTMLRSTNITSRATSCFPCSLPRQKSGAKCTCFRSIAKWRKTITEKVKNSSVMEAHWVRTLE